MIGNPPNVEDLQHNYSNHPERGIRIDAQQKPDDELFNDMTDLIDWFTIFNSDLRTVGHDMIQKFRDRSGGTYSNSTLNDNVRTSNDLHNFLVEFAKELKIKLSQTNGDINSISDFSLSSHPVFNGPWNTLHGLQILLNDTESTQIMLNSFQIDASGNWSMIVTVNIKDHFGLDKNDAMTYQGWNIGFAAWWVLQHQRDYIPFETNITVIKKISGHL